MWAAAGLCQAWGGHDDAVVATARARHAGPSGRGTAPDLDPNNGGGSNPTHVLLAASARARLDPPARAATDRRREGRDRGLGELVESGLGQLGLPKRLVLASCRVTDGRRLLV
jgi:hypothetical protein